MRQVSERRFMGQRIANKGWAPPSLLQGERSLLALSWCNAKGRSYDRPLV